MRRPAVIITVIITILTVCARLLGAFYPESRVWGISHLAYFSTPAIYVLLLIPILALIPAINRLLQSIISRIGSFIYGQDSRKKVLIWLATVSLAVVVFILFRQQTHFLGDGYRWLGNLQKYTTWIKWSEPIEILLHLGLYKVFNPIVEDAALLSYQIVSITAGAMFILLALVAAANIAKSNSERASVFGILVAPGSTLMFFGYAEHYAIAYVSIFASLLFGVRYSESGKRRDLIIALLFGLLSVLSHFLSAIMIPVYLWYFTFTPAMARFRRRISISVEMALAVLVVIAGLFAVMWMGTDHIYFRNILLPILTPQHGSAAPAVLSLKHLYDMLNELVLVGDVLLFIGIGLIVVYRKQLKRSKPVRLLLVAAIFQFTLLLFLDPKLGAACDWDLFTLSTIALTLLSILLIVRLVQSESIRRYILTIVMVSMICAVVPWWLLNSSTERSIARYSHLTDLDWERSKAGRIILRGYFRVKGDSLRAAKEDQEISRLFPAVPLLETAEKYLADGNDEMAMIYADSALQYEPNSAGALNAKGRVYLDRQDFEMARRTLTKAVEIQGESPSIRCNLGVTLYSLGDKAGAMKQLEEAVKLEKGDPVFYSTLASIYSSVGKLEESVVAFKRAIALDTTFAEAYFRLASVQEALGNRYESINNFRTSIRMSDDSVMILEARNHLKSLGAE